MYCGHCGGIIPQSAKFCPTCGKLVQVIEDQNQTSEQYQGQNIPPRDGGIKTGSDSFGGGSHYPYQGNYSQSYERNGDALEKKKMGGCSILLIILGSIAVFFVIFVCILGALLLPAVKRAQEAAQRMHCVNNLKKISTAIYNYHDCYNAMPAAYSVDKEGKPLHSWRVTLLPYFEENELYDAIRLDEPWDSEYNRQFHSKMPDFYRCLSCPEEEAKQGMTNYVGIVGEKAFFLESKWRNLGSITDGTSNTIMIVESRKRGCWMDPENDLPLERALQGTNKNESGPGSFHAEGFNVAFADGSIRYISNSIAPDAFKKLLIINDGQ